MKEAEYFIEGFGDILTAARIAKGMSIKDIAKKTGYTYEGVRQILKENGGYLGVIKVCRALKFNIKDIMKPILGG